MAKSTPQRQGVAVSPDSNPIISLTVDYWQKGSAAIVFHDRAKRQLTHREAINEVIKCTAFTAGELGARIGVSKRTVQGWRSGKSIPLANAQRLVQWLAVDPFTALLADAEIEPPPAVGKRAKPERSESPKSRKPKA